MNKYCSRMIVALCAALLLAPFLAPYDESQQHRSAAMQPPSLAHSGATADKPIFLFGTDEYGRDLFSRFLYAGRRALLVGLLAAAAAVMIGFVAGAFSGFHGGWPDAVLMRCSELFLSLPWMYLLLAIRALLPLRIGQSGSLLMVVSVAALAGWPRPSRIIRGIFLSARDRPYISVARSLGAKNLYIIGRHIFPEVRDILWTQMATLLPQFMLVGVTLSFLGLGEDEQHASWGGMLGALRHFSVMESHSGYLLTAAAITLVLFLLTICG